MVEVVVSSEEVELVKEESEAEETVAKGGGREQRRKKDGLVKWERFLPKIALRVLLVEADDSTRQIIAALLRKCSYRVAAVPDGLKAWEILKRRASNVDLILTEVDLPSISGYALLTLITEHEICKNIPVIMMSSQDSVSTVYKCMLRGATDYLVKPLRRNELRNLWQHVWRRQVSVAIGNVPQDESVGQKKIEVISESHSTTNKEQMEKESDAQSSCMKPNMEVDSTDMEINMQDLSQTKQSKSLLEDTQAKERVHRAICCARDNGNVADANENVDFEYAEPGNSSKEAIDFMGTSVRTNACTRDDGPNKFDSFLQLELSLRRSQPSSLENQSSVERPVLRPSIASAFTRYINRPIQTQCSISPIVSNQKEEVGTNNNNKNSSTAVAYNSSNSPGPPPPPNIPIPWLCQNSYPTPIPVQGIRFSCNNNAINNSSSTPPIFTTRSSPPSPSSISPQEFTSQLRPFHVSSLENNRSEYLQDRLGDYKSDHNLDSLADRGHVSPTTEQSGNGGFSNSVYYGASGSASNSNVDYNVVGLSDDMENKNEDRLSVPAGNSHRSLLREAALTKFRKKRKDRCFEKKVRYESRKKLAEQRPRVKGQFVCRAQTLKASQDNNVS